MQSDEVVTLRLLGKTLTEMRSLMDIDRRNNRSLYDNLTFEVARQIGSLDAKIETLADRVEERFDRMEKRFDRIELLLKEVTNSAKTPT